MARRTLSTQGRILAAGVSVAVGGALAGLMAAADHRADASQTTTPASPSANQTQSGDGAYATPYDGRARTGDTGVSPQPQTRTGGS